MALLDFDSFDYYQTANLPEVYDAVDGGEEIVTGFGICNTNCLKVTPSPSHGGPIRGVAAADGTVILSSYINNTPTGANAPILFVVRQGTIPIFRVIRGLDGSLVGQYNPDAAFPPTSFISDGGLLQGNAWHRLGLKVVLAGGGAGSVDIEIDGVVRQTITGITTSVDGSIWTGYQLGGRQFSAGAVTYYDDVYACDGTGPAPWNDLLGDVHVQRLAEVGPGDLTQFALTGAAANWIAEYDGDTPDIASYVEGAAAGLTDTYTFEDLAVVAGNVIYGVKESALCYKDLSGARSLEFLKRNGGVNFPTGIALGVPSGVGNYAYIKTVMALDPQTGAQWANEAAINGSSGNQFGMTLAT